MAKKLRASQRFGIIKEFHKNGKGIALSITQWAFKVICLLSTSILIVRGINRYLEDNDVTKIDTPAYTNNQIDILPAISLCFHQRFEDAIFQKLGFNVTGKNYGKFLVGEYFDKGMLSIDYESVTTNLSDYMIFYEVSYKNGTKASNFVQERPNIAWKVYSTFSWVNGGKFVKCFTFEITDITVSQVSWHLGRDIFPNGVRPRVDEFCTLFHYPDQILDSINTIRSQWGKKSKDQNYYMLFSLLGMNVFHRRYKPRLHNCIEDWKNYDSIMQEKHINTIGCKAPYQKTIQDWPICNSQEKMKETLFPIQTGLTSPCRTVENIDARKTETYDKNLGPEKQYQNMKIRGKNWKEWFGVTYQFLSDKFTIKINKKEMDFESLVGYIGGYVGLFAGFAVAELPGMLSNGFLSMKQLAVLFARRDGRKRMTIAPRGRTKTSIFTQRV